MEKSSTPPICRETEPVRKTQHAPHEYSKCSAPDPSDGRAAPSGVVRADTQLTHPVSSVMATTDQTLSRS